MAKCPVCDGKYGVKSGNLKRHMKNIHKVEFENKAQLKKLDQVRCEKLMLRTSDPKRGRKQTKEPKMTPPKRSRTIDYLYGDVDPVVSSIISTAVHDLLEQHDICNVM